MRRMRTGIGLPAAVPDADMTLVGRWAAEAEGAGFTSVGVIDRLVYDNLDPLTALAAAAACTTHVELLSTVVNVCWRNNPVLLAKQLASVDRLSGGGFRELHRRRVPTTLPYRYPQLVRGHAPARGT